MYGNGNLPSLRVYWEGGAKGSGSRRSYDIVPPSPFFNSERLSTPHTYQYLSTVRGHVAAAVPSESLLQGTITYQ